MLARKLAQFETEQIEAALESKGGNVSEAARMLKIPRRTLYDKMARLGIDASTFRKCADSCNPPSVTLPDTDDAPTASAN